MSFYAALTFKYWLYKARPHTHVWLSVHNLTTSSHCGLWSIFTTLQLGLMTVCELTGHIFTTM